MENGLTEGLSELNRIRLDEDLSYEALATEIRTAIDGVNIDRTVLYRALNGQRKPNDRTLHKIRRFLDTRKKRPVRRRRTS